MLASITSNEPMMALKRTDSSRLPLKKRLIMACSKRPFRSILNEDLKSTISVSHPPQKKPRLSPAQLATPTKFVQLIHKRQNIDAEEVATKANARFLHQSPERLEAYEATSKAVRDNDLQKLKELHESGVLLDSCNKFGDSPISIACRRGMTSIVKYLVEEAKVSLFVRDDFLRTPLHDACWTAEPNFDIVEMLLKEAPELLVLHDSRGATPFDYIRANHSKPWIEFLARRKGMLLPKD